MERRERMCIQGLTKFWVPPIIPGMGKGHQIWSEHSRGPSEQEISKTFGKKGAWAYPRAGIETIWEKYP